MPALPSFTFPTPEDSMPRSSTPFTRKDKPQIHLDIRPKQYALTVPERRETGSVVSRAASSPPESPVRKRSLSTSPITSHKVFGSGAITPPATPSSASHTKAGSNSSDFLGTLSSLRRGGSTASTSGRMSLDDAPRPGSTELIVFPFQSIDYQYRIDEKGRKKPIGAGAWSDVYLATPSLPDPINEAASLPSGGPVLTPPITPVHSRRSSLRNNVVPAIPPLYAIKVPASTSAKKVLTAEARILSYLSRFPDANKHIVSYYGQDSATAALVLKAMDTTLESWIQSNLNPLDEAARSRNLAAIFPSLALSLIDSLIWMQDKSCIHADIKPSNILVTSTSPTSPPEAVYSDFSSTVLTTLDSASTDTPAPMGAGTWEYLDPSLLSSTNPAPPSAGTDLWSLAITLVFLVLGASPYEAFKHNKYQQREMIKSGSPLQCLTYGDQGIVNLRRIRTLSRDLGFDVVKWFGRVLSKRVDGRCDITAWREELVTGLGERGSGDVKL